jgi:hypothetical protein
MPPEFFPLLKVSMFLFLSDAVGLVAWIVLSVKHRKHLVSLQNYIGIVIGLSTIEMAVIHAFYYHFNETGVPCKILVRSLMSSKYNDAAHFDL